MKGLIVVTYEGSPFFKDCMECLKNYKSYPIYVHTNTKDKNLYELGGIKLGLELKLESMFILADSFMVKDTSIIDHCLDNFPTENVSIAPYFLMYLGKFTRETALKMKIPETMTKREAVNSETRLRDEIKFYIIDQGYTDRPVFEEAYGRKNMILENKWFKKYKGTWSMEMIKD